MKKVLFSALLAVALITNTFATGENRISSLVLNSFKVDFKDAKDVSWSSNTGYAKASFILDKRQMEVFYNTDGTIFAISKKIDLEELPVYAKRTFAKRYAGFTVKEAIKFEGMDENAYYISAENEKVSVILKVDEQEYISLFKSSKKYK
jgi:hypothetical protein